MSTLQCNLEERNSCFEEVYTFNSSLALVKEKLNDEQKSEVRKSIKEIFNETLDFKSKNKNSKLPFTCSPDQRKYSQIIKNALKEYCSIEMRLKDSYFGYAQTPILVGYEIVDHSQTIAPRFSSKKTKEFCEKYQQFQKEKRFIDFQIVCGGKSIAVNSAFLAARCPYFDALFNQPMKESIQGIYSIKEEELQASGTDFESIEKLIGFLYTDEIDLSSCSLEKINKLIAASDLYQVEGLKTACVFALAKLLDEQNANEINEIANRYSLVKLKKICEMYL